MTSGSQWSPGADSWVFRVEISLHFRGTHSVLQRVTGWWVCACIHTCTITRSHPYSHMQHTSTLSWTHTLTTHCCLSHTLLQFYPLWSQVLTQITPSPSRLLQTLRWALHFTLVWLQLSHLRDRAFPKLDPLITHTKTHTLQIECYDWIDVRQLTAARLLTYSISHNCSAMIPRESAFTIHWSTFHPLTLEYEGIKDQEQWSSFLFWSSTYLVGQSFCTRKARYRLFRIPTKYQTYFMKYQSEKSLRGYLANCIWD